MKSGTGKSTSAALLAIPLAATMLLAACGGVTKPNTTDHLKTSSSPSTPVTPTASTSPTAAASRTTDANIPAAARAQTPAGAEAFVRYFYKQLNLAWTTPRAGTLSPLCQASSKGCAALEEDAARLTKQRHRYDGDPVKITFIGALHSTGPNKQDVLARVVQERRSEIDQTGKTYVTDKRKDLRINFELLYTGQAWSVVSSKIMK